MRNLTIALLLPLFAVPAAAQAPAPVTGSSPIEEAAATITESDVARRVAIIADDSMGGRDTPSRGLELTAQYVADQFESFGLKPGGENGTWFQRYPLERRMVDRSAAYLNFDGGKSEHRVSFDGNARLLSSAGTEGEVSGPVLLLSGDPGKMEISPAQVEGHVVMILVDYSEGNRAARVRLSRIAALVRNTEATPAAWLAVSNLDRKEWAELAASSNASVSRVREGDKEEASAPALEIHRSALPKAVDLPAAGTVTVREVPDLTVALNIPQTVEELSAPNTIGVVEGSDPVLKNEYLVFTAHMDHVGIEGGQPDSIYNGADDDASGTTGVIELAEAFSQPGARPKRSVIFMTVSGEEKGLWGSEYYAEHPTVPIGQIVANINLDMIGRNWKDTIVAIGKEHSDLGETLERVNQQHPELHMTAIDDIWPEERFYFRSDHYNFARKGIPILFFFNGVHEDYHQVTDSPEKIDAEKEARVVKLLFYLGEEIANAAERPKWDPESYREIVED